MKSWVAALLVLTTLAAAGCDISARSRVTSSGLLIDPVDARRVGYAVNWTSPEKADENTDVAVVKVVGDLIVTIEEPGNLVTATSAKSGNVVWRRDVASPNDRLFAPVRSGGRIYLNSESHIYTIDARNGEVLSLARLAHVVASGPTLADTYALFGGVDGTVFAHDVNVGRAIWEYKLTSRILTPPVIAGLNVFVADSTGVYVMLTVANGDRLWRGRSFGAVTAPPAIDRLGVFMPSQDQTLYALHRTTGKDKWKFRTSQRLTEPAVSIGLMVYLPVPGEGLVAINSVNGDRLWRLDTPARPLTVRDRMLVQATNDSIHVVDTETGVLIHEAPTLRLRTVLHGPDDSLILVSPKGRMLRLNPS